MLTSRLLLTSALALAAPAALAQVPNVPPPPPAAEAPGFDMLAALRALEQSHPLLQAYRTAERAAGHDILAASMWTNPQFNVQYYRSVTNYTSYDPQLGQAQFWFGQLLETSNLPGARRAVAEAQRDAAHAETYALRAGLYFDLYAALGQLALARARVEVLRAHLALLTEAERVVEARVREGAAPRYDRDRLGLAQSSAEADLADAEGDVLAARGALAVAVGPGFARLQGEPRFVLEPLAPLPALAGLLERAAEQPTVQVAVARVRAAQGQVEVARRSVLQGVFVQLGVGVGAGYADSNTVGCTNGTAASLCRQVDLMASVSLPLPLVDRGQHTIAAAQARALAAQELVEAVRALARQRVETAYAEVQRRRAALERFVATDEAHAAEFRRAAEAGYREGRLSILELVDAYTSLRDGRLRRLALLRDARAAEVALLRAAGAVP